ncbi:hypothetical protein [Hufsiella ginkgonis]|uniref:Uncharacterized protein n=1 Tax=Hufsiella ginkgonis TaxID=2695274 RepID=A0A7K1XZP5_9SPHI|nr:hypothetical protein [Hufsiella ginkgonis]MXV16440.1 hypothetical protein [Hufsiella ginkgonis]
MKINRTWLTRGATLFITVLLLSPELAAGDLGKWRFVKKTALIRVLLSSVKGNGSSQAIYLYRGNAGAASANDSQAVLDTGMGVTCVWHLNETDPRRIQRRHEARVMNQAKDEHWARLDYESQKEGQRFTSYGKQKRNINPLLQPYAFSF